MSLTIKLSLLYWLISNRCYAEIELGLGLGQTASNMMEPLSIILNLIYTCCFILGSGFIFASLIKYIEHRRSPLMVTISLVVTLLLSGLALILLPFLSYLTGHGFLHVFTELA